MNERITYWVGRLGSGWALHYRNSDTEDDVAGPFSGTRTTDSSERSGLCAVLRVRIWAWRNGCGWPGVRR
jgi:hypothetical protein